MIGNLHSRPTSDARDSSLSTAHTELRSNVKFVSSNMDSNHSRCARSSDAELRCCAVFCTTVSAIWLWKLTLLTALAVGAWLVGVGVFAVHMVWENEWKFLKAGMLSYTSFAVLELIALGRFPGNLSWIKTVSWLYILLIFSILLVGLYGLTKQVIDKG